MSKNTASIQNLLDNCHPFVSDFCTITGGTFRGVKSKVSLDTPYGPVVMPYYSLMDGAQPSISSAIDKTDYFVRQASEKHNNFYDYRNTIYKRSHSKVNIICPVHGEFQQSPNNHLAGKGCQKCSVGTKVTWSHSSWKQSGQTSKNFDGYKLYLILCTSEDERFYKIGKTYQQLSKRFHNCDMPYEFEILDIVEGESKEISVLEKKIQKKNKRRSYRPKRRFKGFTECFSSVNFNGTYYA